jgi:hypothetical protein
MPIEVVCSQCGKSMQAPDSAAGKKGRCKTCGAVFQIPIPIRGELYPASTAPPPVPAQPHAGEPTRRCDYCGETIHATARKCRHCGEVLDPALREARQRRASDDSDSSPNVVIYNERSGCSGMARGCVIVAVVLALGGALVGYVVIRSLGEAAHRIQEQAKQAQRNPAPRAEPDAIPYPTAGKLGNVQVQVTRVVRGKVPIERTIGEDAESKSDLLSVYVEITNLDPALKVDYRTFAGELFTIDKATLKDDVGNTYRLTDFGISAKPKGATTSAAIHPGKAISDHLVFELPVDQAQFLILELPADRVGIPKGAFRFKIPVSAIETR